MKVHISSLRRTLGDNLRTPEYIATIAGHGYQFIEKVFLDRSGIEDVTAIENDRETPCYSLPHYPPLVGRESDIERIARALDNSSLLTLVGAGGVGKTSLAVTAAHRLCDRFPDGAHFVDLSAAEGPSLVAQVITRSLGVRGDPPDLLEFLSSHLRGRSMLLILDNCEHVLSYAADLCAKLQIDQIGGAVIATSRAPLGIRREQVVRVEPLASPHEDTAIRTMRAAVTYPAVELFALRARDVAAVPLSDEDVPAIIRLCRLLDGLPLAIEIVTAQLDRFTPDQLLDSMRRHFPLEEGSARDVHPRQRTLRGTLDWSFELLSKEEATVFCLVSTFAGAFGPSEVTTMVKLAGFDIYQTQTALAGLLSKSLLAGEVEEDQPTFRLLTTTRSYASGRLEKEEYAPGAHRQHALVVLAVLERAESEWGWIDHDIWRLRYADRVSDIRKALDWCFGEKGDTLIGVSLSAAAIRLWNEQSLISEQQFHVKRAFLRLDEAGSVNVEAAALATAQAWSLTLGRDFHKETADAWTKALDLAVKSADIRQQLSVMFGQAVFLVYAGRHGEAVTSMQAARKIAAKQDPSAVFDSDRIQALAELHLGRVLKVQPVLERLSTELSIQRLSKSIRYSLQRFVGVQTTLAFSTWLVGRQEEALFLAEQTVSTTGEQSQIMGQSHTLALSGLPVAFWSGQFDTVQRYSTLLHDNLAQEHLAHWIPLDRFYRALIRQNQGDMDALSDMEAAADQLHRDGFLLRLPMYLGIVAELRLHQRQFDTVSVLLEKAASVLQKTREQWYLPELLRVRAGLILAEHDPEYATRPLHRAQALARRAGSIALESRISSDLARLRSSY